MEDEGKTAVATQGKRGTRKKQTPVHHRRNGKGHIKTQQLHQAAGRRFEKIIQEEPDFHSRYWRH